MKEFLIGGAILLYIIIKQKRMNDNFEKINASLDSIGDSVSNVAADINKLVAAQADGLSAEQATGIASKLEAVAANIKQVADIVPDESGDGGGDTGGGDETPVTPEV